jgi:MFS transporter, PAT family, beta-lactamase induction signal transducer AmpG
LHWIPGHRRICGAQDDNLVGYSARTLQTAKYSDVFRDRTLAVVLLLGFSSGLPIALVSSTLQAWLTVEGVDLATIGLITLVGIPYTWKFLWAPAMDRFVPPLGRRRGWLVITQGAIVAGLAAMAFLSPRTDILLLASLALFVAFMSASQDVAVDAYRADVATPEQRGIVAALGVLGYRLAMLTSGALALVLAAGSGFIGSISSARSVGRTRTW